MSTAERAAGFYWVRRSADWTVAEWYPPSQCWEIVGSNYPFHDSDMTEIDERPIQRQP